MRRWPIGSLLILSLHASAPTLAGSTGAIGLSGTVAQRCEITSAPGNTNLGTLSGTGSTLLNFTYTCNTPFTYALTSTNDALKHTTFDSPQNSVANTLAYSVTLNLPTSGTAISHTTIASASIDSTVSGNSGTDIAIAQNGTLTIHWDASASYTTAPILADGYADTLTLTFTAQ